MAKDSVVLGQMLCVSSADTISPSYNNVFDRQLQWRLILRSYFFHAWAQGLCLVTQWIVLILSFSQNGMERPATLVVLLPPPYSPPFWYGATFCLIFVLMIQTWLQILVHGPVWSTCIIVYNQIRLLCVDSNDDSLPCKSLITMIGDLSFLVLTYARFSLESFLAPESEFTKQVQVDWQLPS